jgi:VanZ family protein
VTHAGRIALPLAWMAVLWFLSSLPGTTEGLAGWYVPELLHEAAHPVVYAILVTSWHWALAPQPWGTPLASFGLSMAYAIIDELHQGFVPGRTSSMADLFADGAGAAVGLALVIARARRARDRRTSVPADR